MKITFHNVMITIEAEGRREAYRQLRDVFDYPSVSAWKTDTYTADDEDDHVEQRDTAELV